MVEYECGIASPENVLEPSPATPMPSNLSRCLPTMSTLFLLLLIIQLGFLRLQSIIEQVGYSYLNVTGFDSLLYKFTPLYGVVVYFFFFPLNFSLLSKNLGFLSYG